MINNPALGAYLLWKYALAYRDSHSEHASSPGILVFLVLPIVFHKPTLEFLQRTNKGTGLVKFSEKFLSRDNKKSDLLLKIHSRAIEMREISVHAMGLAITKGLIYLDHRTGFVIPCDKATVGSPNGIPPIVDNMERNSEKLGLWFSKVSLRDISFYLKVNF